MNVYAGRTTVLTGASQGIGRALALAPQRPGWCRRRETKRPCWPWKRNAGSGGAGEERADRTLEAMAARRRMLVFTAKGKLRRFVLLVAPGLVDRLGEQAVARGR